VIPKQVPTKLKSTISRLSNEVAAADSSSYIREAAVRTGGVPVYADMGGVLVVAPDGSTLHYEPASRKIDAFVEERWRLLALVRAARKYPELSELRPARPETARSCRQCGGTGLVVGQVDCGVCDGTGWTA